ncbi:TetR family transcriptional regulator [Microbispora rosea subsp. aerata]|nr:TetR/AcrR family transcriptional regulator [Microbispora rosea]GGO07645.1 TetR family transcriptional regulator [Microbispora rosea subsp. aerata]GIH53239.1 TetR family transcriptional regulator [Microbispora rosea subsp. aerata]GLJ83849.1 TetR family transcriptional regulator [Microbispora rosea subsp. aerata]
MEEGLRERKKRETRQRIADIAMGLFLQRGFDNVTVAEVARAADVSVNTVFNYFRTKEDLFLDRSEESEDLLARAVRERRAGETAVQAVRRDFFEALDAGDWRYGMSDGLDLFTQRVRESLALQSRVRLLDVNREERLARTLAEETGADPDDPTPWLVSAQICAVVRALTRHFAVRQTAGEDPALIRADLREHAGRAFDLLEHGIGGYCPRP